MFRIFHLLGLVFVAGLAAQPAFAETPNEILASIQKEAAGTPGFQGFSAARGESFFKAKHGGEWSCASCHTENPVALGQNGTTPTITLPFSPPILAGGFPPAPPAISFIAVVIGLRGRHRYAHRQQGNCKHPEIFLLMLRHRSSLIS